MTGGTPCMGLGTPTWDWGTPPAWDWGNSPPQLGLGYPPCLGLYSPASAWNLGPVTGVPLRKGHGTSNMGWRWGTPPECGQMNTVKTVLPHPSNAGGN